GRAARDQPGHLARLGEAGPDRRGGPARGEPCGRGADQAVGEGERRAPSGERDLADGVGFLRGGARPPLATVVDYIEDHREMFGVEPICRTLSQAGCPIAPSTYYAARSRAPAARAARDAQLAGEIARVHRENF